MCKKTVFLFMIFLLFGFPLWVMSQQIDAIPGQKIIVEYKENPIVHDYIGTWESEDGNIRFRLEHKVETGENFYAKMKSDYLYLDFKKFLYEGQDLKEYWGKQLSFLHIYPFWNARVDRDQTYVWRLWDFIPGSNKNEFEVTYYPLNAISPKSKELVHRLKFKVRRVMD